MPSTLNRMFYVAIALVILFTLLGSMVMTQFNKAYNPSSCSASKWIDNTAVNNATNTGECYIYAQRENSGTLEYNTSATGCDTANFLYCKACSNYAWGTASSGMILLIMVIALVGFAVAFFKLRR